MEKFYRDVVAPRELGIGEFTPVIMFADDAHCRVFGTEFDLYYIEDSHDADCVQIPLPMELIMPLERAILLAESLRIPSLNDKQREVLQREFSSAKRQSGWDRYETRDSIGHLVGYPEGSYILSEWGLDRIKYNHVNKCVVLDIALDEKDRLEAIRGQLNGNSCSLTNEQRDTLITERSRLRRSIKYPPMDWRNLFRTAKEHLKGGGHDFRAVASTLSYLRSHMEESDSKPLVLRLNNIISKYGASTVQLDGVGLTVDELVVLISEGDEKAKKAVIDLLVSTNASNGVSTRSARLKADVEYPLDHRTEG